jgi:hypothetical protein
MSWGVIGGVGFVLLRRVLGVWGSVRRGCEGV